MDNKYKYVIHCRGIEGRRDKPPASLWFWFVCCAAVAIAALLWFLAWPKDVQANKFINELTPGKNKTFYAYTTHYTCGESVNANCITASGTVGQEGNVACPRFIRLGQKISFEGREYICADRYALWLDRVRDLPTIDIFTTETTQEAIAWGKQKAVVEIIE